MKKMNLTIALIAIIFNTVAQDSWTPKENFSGGERYGAVCFSINNKGYIGLGHTGYGGENKIKQDFWEYTPDINNKPLVQFDVVAVTTLAGNGEMGFADGTKETAKFSSPSDVAVDSFGNIYVADSYNNSIRKISALGIVTTLAGNGTAGFNDGIGTNAKFNHPSGVALDTKGNVYVADEGNNCIRKINKEGVVTTLLDNNGAIAQCHTIKDVAVADDGSIYFSETYEHRIRKITPQGVISTFAGSGSSGYIDGIGTNAQFIEPFYLAFDRNKNLYVTDIYGSIRKITPYALVSTIQPVGMYGFKIAITVDKFDMLYVSIIDDGTHNRINKITPSGNFSLVAGSLSGYQDGMGSDAKFNSPTGLSMDIDGNLFVADQGNNRIRKLSTPNLNFKTEAGTASAVRSFNISGINIEGTAYLSAPTGFEVSVSESGGFSSGMAIGSNSGEINTLTIYTRLKASLGFGNYSGDFILSTNGADSKKLSVTGVVTDTTPPTITCIPAQKICFSNTNKYQIPTLTASDISGIKHISYTVSGTTQRKGVSLDASGLFNVGISNITWVVTDNAGNTNTCQTIVTINPPLTVSIPNVYPLLIWGEVNTLYQGYGPNCTTLLALPSGGTKFTDNSYQYKWSNGSTAKWITVCPATAGTYQYSVTITDAAGCRTTASTSIFVKDVRCGNKLNKVTVCLPGKHGNKEKCLNENEVFMALFMGGRLGNCTGNQTTSRSTNPAIEEEATVNSMSNLMVMPNPNNGSFMLKVNNINAVQIEVRIIDQNGKTIANRRLQAVKGVQTLQIDLGHIAQGVYTVQAVSTNGVATTKMIVQ